MSYISIKYDSIHTHISMNDAFVRPNRIRPIIHWGWYHTPIRFALGFFPLLDSPPKFHVLSPMSHPDPYYHCCEWLAIATLARSAIIVAKLIKSSQIPVWKLNDSATGPMNHIDCWFYAWMLLYAASLINFALVCHSNWYKELEPVLPTIH